MENIYVVCIDVGYGEYVYLVRAESEEEACKKAMANEDEMFSKVLSITPIVDLIKEMKDDTIMLGGYAE